VLLNTIDSEASFSRFGARTLYLSVQGAIIGLKSSQTITSKFLAPFGADEIGLNDDDDDDEEEEDLEAWEANKADESNPNSSFSSCLQDDSGCGLACGNSGSLGFRFEFVLKV